MSNIAWMVVGVLQLVSQYVPLPPRGQSNLGYVILWIIVSPVVILLLMSLLGHPRKTTITVIFLGFLTFMFCAFVAITFVLSYLTSFFY